MSPQARAARFFNKFSSYKNFPPSRYRESGRGVGPPRVGPARIYINRHPQPPAKGTGFYGISQSLYTRRVKINMLTDPGTWDIVGLCLIKG